MHRATGDRAEYDADGRSVLYSHAGVYRRSRNTRSGACQDVLVLRAVGLPVEGIGLILAIDWLLDRFRTTATSGRLCRRCGDRQV